MRRPARASRLTQTVWPRQKPDSSKWSRVIEREDLGALRVVELDLRIAAEDRDPHDHRFDRAVCGLVEELDVVRADEDVAERLCVADERHHELARGLVVELARAADLLERARG